MRCFRGLSQRSNSIISWHFHFYPCRTNIGTISGDDNNNSQRLFALLELTSHSCWWCSNFVWNRWESSFSATNYLAVPCHACRALACHAIDCMHHPKRAYSMTLIVFDSRWVTCRNETLHSYCTTWYWYLRVGAVLCNVLFINELLVLPVCYSVQFCWHTTTIVSGTYLTDWLHKIVRKRTQECKFSRGGNIMMMFCWKIRK